MRAIFLDRDGVICENRTDHVKSWSEFRFLPGAKNGLATLRNLGLPIVVVSNQAVINRGLMSASLVDEIHERMIAEVAACGGRIDRVIYCPHRPEEQCACRKPEPGMLRQCAEEMKLNLKHSYLVGDAVTDLMAGERVGCKTFLVLTGRGIQQLMPALRLMGGGFTVTRNLMDAATQIFKAELNVTDEVERRNLAQTEPYRQVLSAANRF